MRLLSSFPKGKAISLIKDDLAVSFGLFAPAAFGISYLLDIGHYWGRIADSQEVMRTDIGHYWKRNAAELDETRVILAESLQQRKNLRAELEARLERKRAQKAESTKGV